MMKNEIITISVTFFLVVSAKSGATGLLSLLSPLADGTIKSGVITKSCEVLLNFGSIMKRAIKDHVYLSIL